MNGQDINQPQLPHKLPPRDRKKLSLLIDTNNQDDFHLKHINQESTNAVNDDDSSPYYKKPYDVCFYKTQNKPGEHTNKDNYISFQMSNDTYLSFDQPYDNESIKLGDDADTDTYFVLNDFYSDIPATKNSIVSNSSEAVNTEECDEEDYFIPFGFQTDKEDEPSVEASSQSEDDICNDLRDVYIDRLVEEEAPRLVVNKPKLPIKMSRLDFTKSLKLKNLINVSKVNSDQTVDEMYSSLPSNEISLDQFMVKIFKNESNKNCADCSVVASTWISCRYFITLCNSCAALHLKIPHYKSKLDPIEISHVYNELKKSEDIQGFLQILSQTGNEKMNSLYEFQTDLANNYRKKYDAKFFIKEKYLNKRFINLNELNVNENYLENLNKILCVPFLCIPIIIYNYFLGANLNYARIDKTVMDISCENSDQTSKTYLKFNNALKFNEIDESILENEFIGELTQIFDMNPTVHSLATINALAKSLILVKLDKINMNLIQIGSEYTNNVQFRNRRLELQINNNSIIKILVHSSKNLIEIKWCNQANHSLISSYLQYTDLSEKHVWVKEMFFKLLSSFYTPRFPTNDPKFKTNFVNLLSLSDYCQIDLCGFLSLASSPIQTEIEEQIFAVLMKSNESQLNYFKRLLVIIRVTEPYFEMIDLRKAILNHNETYIRIDYLNKVYILQSNGYPQNLKDWFDKIALLGQIKLSSIEDQYLTKETVPVLVEKCCSFVEMNLILQNRFYQNTIVNSTVKLQSINSKLLTDRKFELHTATTESILFFFTHFFCEYIQEKHFEILIRASSKLFSITPKTVRDIIDNVDLNKFELNEANLTMFLQKQIHHNPVFYCTLRRMCIHLNLLTHYTYKNDMHILYLADFLTSLIFDLENYMKKNFHSVLNKIGLNEGDFSYEKALKIVRYLVTGLLATMIENCVSIFGLKSNYLKIQIEMIETSFDVKSIKSKLVEATDLRQSDQTFLITIFYNEIDSGQSFQLNADRSYTCEQALMRAKSEFGFTESKYLSLFEVSVENEGLLERPLAVDEMLIECLSSWTSFNLCVRNNIIDIELEKIGGGMTVRNFYEECEVMVLCRGCGSFLDSRKVNQCNSTVHRKWKKCYLLIQGNLVKIFRRTFKSIKLNKNDYPPINTPETEFKDKTLKVSHEIRPKEALFYYGLYTSIIDQENVTLNKSMDTSWTNSMNISTSEMIINDEECLTVYDKRSHSVFCIHLKTKQKACEWYKNMFDMANNEGSSWTCFASSHLPDLIKPETRYFTISTDDRSSVFGSIFKKMIRK